MPWLFLCGAILTEVTGTMALKLSNGFMAAGPTAVVVVSYVVSFSLLGLALKTIDIAIAYAIWAGTGTALIAIAGAVLFGETLTALRIACIVLIIVGVVGLHMADGKAA